MGLTNCFNENDDRFARMLKEKDYKKFLELVEKYKEYITKYGENGKKTIALGKKIDEEVQKIYND